MEAIEVFSQFGLQCFKETDNKLELREQAFGYFSEISKILKSDMAPILPTVLENIFKSAISEDGIKAVAESQKANKVKDFSLESDDSNEEDEKVCGLDVD